MKTSNTIFAASALAAASLLAGCATWHDMDRSEKGTAVGATGGAIVGAAVGGPIGAAVGAGVGGYTGHYEAGAPSGSAPAQPVASSPVVRSAQQSLNDKGYNVGSVDGVWGPDTASAVARFQESRGLPQTGRLDDSTLSALGVSR
ncbi:MAG TPA: peptidoglycan-binding domain-containing protein [Casimicrobiaceae bacterium]|nr:peptidoglycan-binding domain-containing protein [Casimicrobiaceae bacterium]